MNVVFIVDSSRSIESINPARWQSLLNFIKNVGSKLTIGPDAVHVGLVRFSAIAREEFSIADHIIDNLEYKKMVDQVVRDEDVETNIADGLRKADALFGKLGERPHVPRVAILVTDGLVNKEVAATVPMADELRRQGIDIICVGVDVPGENEIKILRRISSHNKVLTTSDYDKLFNLLQTCIA